jgi:hypothetical protein
VRKQPSPAELNRLLLGVGRHGREIVLTALRRGIYVTRTNTKGGTAWRFRSQSVDILVVDPKYLSLRELNPA